MNKHLLLFAVLISFLFSSCAKGSREKQDGSQLQYQNLEKLPSATFDSIFSTIDEDWKNSILNNSSFNSPHFLLLYTQKIEGYNVAVDYFPGKYDVDEGEAFLHFYSNEKTFSVYHPRFSDYQLTKLFSKTELNLLKDSIIFLDYNYKEDPEYFGNNAVPFFFQDMNFDGELDLLLRYKGTSWKGSDDYRVYTLINADLDNLDPILLPPFDAINSYTAIHYKEKTIENYIPVSIDEFERRYYGIKAMDSLDLLFYGRSEIPVFELIGFEIKESSQAIKEYKRINGQMQEIK